MDAMMWMILVAAVILAAGIVAYFEGALRRSPFSQLSPSSPGQRDFSSQAEPEAQSAPVNPPATGEVALMSSALPRGKTGQSQS
jgi:hypothetical protein